MKYYLAYGSNLNVSQMGRRCPSARIAGYGFIPDYTLVFRGSKTGSYLTIEPCEGKRVPVGVWTVTPADEHNLDRYEGFPIFYTKVPMKIDMVTFDDPVEKKAVDAFAYIMTPGHPLGEPSREYVWTCIQGYSDFNFSLTPLEDAVFESVEEAI